MERRAKYEAGSFGRLAGVVDRTLRRLDDLKEKIETAQLDPALLEECEEEMEEITRILGDSIREALDGRRTYA